MASYDPIREQSAKLIPLEEKSLQILKVLAEEGPQNIYSLHKSLPRIAISSIRRRFEGSTDIMGLEKEHFIQHIVNKRFRGGPNPYRRFYALDFKGFLASLQVTDLHSHRYFSEASDFFRKYYSREFSRVIQDYVITEIGLWFQFHIENELSPIKLRSPYIYYYSTKDVEKLFRVEETKWNLLLPEEYLDPESEYVPLKVDAIGTYTNTFYELLEDKKKARETLEVELTKSNEVSRRMVDRWFEVMSMLILIHKIRGREEERK